MDLKCLFCRTWKSVITHSFRFWKSDGDWKQSILSTSINVSLCFINDIKMNFKHMTKESTKLSKINSSEKKLSFQKKINLTGKLVTDKTSISFVNLWDMFWALFFLLIYKIFFFFVSILHAPMSFNLWCLSRLTKLFPQSICLKGRFFGIYNHLVNDEINSLLQRVKKKKSQGLQKKNQNYLKEFEVTKMTSGKKQSYNVKRCQSV